MRSKVLMIYTGGTIGMVQDPLSGLFKPFNFKQIQDAIPEIKNLDIRIDSVSLDKPVDSSNISPNHWKRMTQIISDNYPFYDGFVILHGSDTMSFTASMLSFMLEGLEKPVILTGSQLPIGVVRTDGKENLITALEIAAAKRGDGTPVVPEVAIYFEYHLYRGNRTHKYNAEHFEAFHSPNYPPLARAGVNINYNYNLIRPSGSEVLCPHYDIDNSVAIIKLFPGIPELAVLPIVSHPNLKALVLETFGAGNAPMLPWLNEALESAISDGKIILNVTQCNAGSVMQRRYETSVALDDMGVISGEDMTTEAAVTKLMFLLGKKLSLEETMLQVATNIRGEMSVN